MNRNYRKEFNRYLEEEISAGRRKSLLLHACCACCASTTIERLSQRLDLTYFFYNPNIDSLEEYNKRAYELERLIFAMQKDGKTGQGQIKLIVPEYDPTPFKSLAKGHELDPEKGERCLLCYRLRLSKTLEEFNRSGSYDNFSTTLTMSTQKSSRAINGIGEEISNKYQASDFKKENGFNRSLELSKEYSLYRQDYCGCIYSRRAKTLSLP